MTSDSGLSIASQDQEIYEKLELPSRGIRLLTLAPCSRSSQVKWELKPYPLGQLPKYEALSYTWGDPTTKGTIIINERPLPVARYLLEAMQNLCHEQTGFTIWIDAICINQGDIKERNHQVGLMKDIYQNASRVIVWLGPKSTYSDKAIALLHTLSSNYITEDILFTRIYGHSGGILSRRKFVAPRPIATGSEDESLSAPYDHESWEGFTELFHREWFYRMWTLQEIVLAKDAVFRCGDKQTSLEQLTQAAYLINMHNRSPSMANVNNTERLEQSGYHTILGIIMTRKDYLGTGMLDMISLLADCWNRKSSDPRDRIYGLLGLTEMSSIFIDYDLPVVDVYRAFAEIVATSSKSLEILRMKRYPSIKGLPSWVPDWSTVSKKQNPPSAKGLYHAAANSKTQPCFGKFGSMTTQGVVVDTIEFVGAEAAMTGVQIDAGFRDDWESVAYGFGRLDRSARDAKLLEEARNSPYISGGSKWEAFARTLVADRWNDQRWSPDTSVAGILCLWETNHDLIQPRDGDEEMAKQLRVQYEEDITRFNITWFQECRHRRLFVTNQGYIGLAPPAAKEGDLVCVLLGADVPFILRHSDVHCRYLLIGETYVHGIMDGEKFQDINAYEFVDFDMK